MQSGAISQQDAKVIEALLSLPGGLTLHQYVSFSAPCGPEALLNLCAWFWCYSAWPRRDFSG